MSFLLLLPDVSSGPVTDLIDQLCLIKSHICPTSYETSSDLLESIDSFKEHYYDLHQSLLSLPPDTHTFAHVFVVGGLAKQLLVLSGAVQTFIDDSAQSDQDPCIVQACMLLKILFGDIESLMVHLLHNSDQLIQRFVGSASIVAVGRLFLYLRCILKIIAIDCPTNSSGILDTVGSIIKEKLVADQLVDKTKPIMGNQEMFSLVLAFLRTCYVSGCSTSTEPLLRLSEQTVLTPEYALVHLKSVSIAFLDFVNYFKYAAYNLMTIALVRSNASDARKDRLTASIYLKIVRALPNMAVSNYENDLELHRSIRRERAWPKKSVTLVQRLEFSLLYVLNALLLIADLQDVIFPSPSVKAELTFLSRTLSATLSNEITQSALQPQSVHHSVVSMLDAANEQLEAMNAAPHSVRIDNSNTHSISSILYHGLYKEKHQLIVVFCELWSSPMFSVPSFNVNCQQAFQRYGVQLQPDPFRTGKDRYLECIRHVSRTLSVLALKRAFVNNGLSHVPFLAINELLGGLLTIEELVQWDTSISYEVSDVDGTEYINFEFKESMDTPANFKEMSDINDLTQSLQCLREAL